MTPSSAAQLVFRPAADAWSVKDVVEHRGIAEPQYWTQVTDSLKLPARLTSTHAQRHIQQIREIKAAAGYPKA